MNEDPTIASTVDLGEDLVGKISELPPQLPAPAASRYQLVRLLGRGGSGDVFCAKDPLLRRQVAIKVLGIPVDTARFLREARIMAQLEHPHIVPVHDFGVGEDGTPWIAMTLIEGRTLGEWARELGDDRLQREGLLDVLDILDRICDALAYAHSRGVLHLDLKPTNVMVGDFGRVWLMDWGIARVLTGDLLDAPGAGGKIYGTPSYVAPEQVTSPDDLDERTDIYGLGALLYALLCGEAPHGTGAVKEVLRAAARSKVIPLEERVQHALPAGLSSLVADSLDRNPDLRPQSVAVFQARLRAIRRSTWTLPQRSVAPGEAVVRMGEQGTEAFVITSGTCEVRNGDGEVVRTLGPGDVFGELAVLSGGVRSMDVIAKDAVVLHVVDRKALASGMGLGTWAGRFARALAVRFAELEQRLEARTEDG